MSDAQVLATPDAPLSVSLAAGRCAGLAAGGTHFPGEILALLGLVDRFHCFSTPGVSW
jgi:hypothetical protein